MEIKSLKNISFTTIHEAFSLAFADYGLPPMNQDKLFQMVTRRGFNPELSFGAFENELLVSFTLNGIGSWLEKKTAYDTGTGTLPEYRGKGLAKQIFIESVPVLKENGIQQYLLEVLQDNVAAANLYKKQGFEITREFNYYVGKKSDVEIPVKQKYKAKIEEIELSEVQLKEGFFDFIPSWQNSFDSINRRSNDFVKLGAKINDKLVGYILSETENGDLTQLAVHSEFRKNGIGSALLAEIFKKIPGDDFKLINSDLNCDSINGFMANLGISPAGKQFEMIKQL